MRTLGQKRAEFALTKILENDNKSIDKLKSFSAGAPTIILQNGFGQAMAFWLSKSGEEDEKKKYKFIFESIKEWLSKENNFIKPKDDKNENFILKISEISQEEYLYAQKEAIFLLEWIKRYTAAFCEDKKR